MKEGTVVEDLNFINNILRFIFIIASVHNKIMSYYI